jgi:hypothetical protein
MLSLPIALRSAIGVVAPGWSRPGWPPVPVLLPGAVLAPGKRTVTAILQSLGRRAEPDDPPSQRVLPRAVWSPLSARRRRLCVAVCVPSGVVLCGLDDPIERRRGEPRPAHGLSRAPGRSAQAPRGKARGRRWLGGRLLPPRAWAQRGWAVPWLTVWGPSERGSHQPGRRPHPLLDRAWPRLQRVRRWVPGRAGVLVADSRVAALAWLALVAPVPGGRVRPRLRLAAALSAPAPPRVLGPRGRPRLTGQRRPTWETGLADAKTPWSTLPMDDG